MNAAASRGPLRGTGWLAALPLAAAVAFGTWVRWQQWFEQVLIDDEWHLVHRLVLSTPREMFFDFGYADYGIPLALAYSALGSFTSLSESTLRVPMLAAGVITLVLLPALVLRRVGLATATLFAWLLAISPLLIVYSRLARPYALVVVLIWVAVFAIDDFAGRARGRWMVGALAVGAGTLAAWMHLAMAGFVAAAFAVAAVRIAYLPSPQREQRLWRLGVLAIAMAGVAAALVLPPLLAHPEAMALKSGVATPNLDTVLGAWFAWTGTTSPWIAAAALLLALIGVRPLARAVPAAAALALGVLLVLALVFASRPASSQYGIILARYLLPGLPLALLAVAVGAMTLVRGAAHASPGIAYPAGGGCAVLGLLALVVNSPVREWWERPNGHALHMQYYFDFRPGRNEFVPHLAAIPDTGLWRSLAHYPPGTLTIAAAPFYFESFNWNAPEWEGESGQTVIPGYLSGLCVDWRFGEVPAGSRFAFRNAVHLGDAREVAARGVDLVVWQKSYVRGTDLVGEETMHCEAALRERFGAPVYDDRAVMAFAVNRGVILSDP